MRLVLLLLVGPALATVFASTSAADHAVCTPDGAACAGTYSCAHGAGGCGSGEYVERRSGSVVARHESFTVRVVAENDCMHANWNDYEASSLHAYAQVEESSTRQVSRVIVRWAGDSLGCDTSAAYRGIPGQPPFAFGVGCPTGRGPGLLVPALP